MRTHVEFRSDAFSAEAGEEEAVNPGRWGAAVARFLRQELSIRGLPGREPVAEDWGYCIPIDNQAFNLWVGCGNYEEYLDGFCASLSRGHRTSDGHFERSMFARRWKKSQWLWTRYCEGILVCGIWCGGQRDKADRAFSGDHADSIPSGIPRAVGSWLAVYPVAVVSAEGAMRGGAVSRRATWRLMSRFASLPLPC